MPGPPEARPPLVQRRLSPATYRHITAFAAWALGFIIVTGGLVRVTGSGLGCPDWPTCAQHRVFGAWQYHQAIESGNRIVTGAVSIAVVLAVLGALVRSPRRRDLTLLSWGLVAGVVGQIVLGGETVKHQLAPPFVMGHFLLSLLLLWDAIVLHHRAGLADEGVTVPVVPRQQVLMARLAGAAAAIVVFMGTVVTSTGPHGGDPKARRLGFSMHQVVRLHSIAVWLFLAVTALALVGLVGAAAPAAVIRRGELLVAAIVLQGGIGYAQYFSGVPAWLVAIHLAGAATVWAAVIRLNTALSARTPLPAGYPARRPVADTAADGNALEPDVPALAG
jgi:cytochrome c oxidase assembly protein subunit 15